MMLSNCWDPPLSTPSSGLTQWIDYARLMMRLVPDLAYLIIHSDKD